MNDFRDLRVWGEALAFVDATYRFAASLPASERFNLVSQMQRASVSVTSNIAEGWGRRAPNDFGRFLRMAYASTCEAQSQVRTASHLGLGDDQLVQEVLARGDVVRRMLSGLIASLRRSDGATTGRTRGDP